MDYLFPLLSYVTYVRLLILYSLSIMFQGLLNIFLIITNEATTIFMLIVHIKNYFNMYEDCYVSRVTAQKESEGNFNVSYVKLHVLN